jgi:hypothetical protein
MQIIGVKVFAIIFKLFIFREKKVGKDSLERLKYST